MAPTIIRVKRKIDETQEADAKIVLNCKKQKLSDKDVFSFVGTVNEENNIPDHILKISKKEAESIVLNKSNQFTSGLSNRVSENLEKLKEKRFKVVNFMRSSEKSDYASNGEQIILDVEREYECTSNEDNKSTDDLSKNSTKYIYDIYVAQDEFSSILQADVIDLNDLSILEYNDYLYSCPRLTNDIDEDLPSSDDSNDENNWRNDYPDEEDLSDSSIDERAMRRAMQNFGIDNDLSSSDDNDEFQESNSEGFVYSINTEDDNFEDDYDYTDADHYSGTSYAKYRKRMLKDLQSDSEKSSDDDDDD